MQDLLIKAATLIAVALATFSSFPGTAQPDPIAPPQHPQVQKNARTQQNSAQPNSDGASMSKPAAALKPVSRESMDKLDVKSAKQSNSATAVHVHRGSKPDSYR